MDINVVTDPEARAAAIAEEAAAVEAYMAADERGLLVTAAQEAADLLTAYDEGAPETPVTDLIAGLMAQLAPAKPAAKANGKGTMDEDHARAWITANPGLAKWPAIQAYRREGFAATTDRFHEIHAEVAAA